MARITINDLPPNASSHGSALSEVELDNVVGGALTLSSSMYFASRTTLTQSTQLPLPGGSLVKAPALSGVRG